MATNNSISGIVVALPTAAIEPVVNPRWHGRYPKGVVLMPHWILRRPPRLEQEVIVTTDGCRGTRAKIVSIRKHDGDVWFTLESLGRPFTGLLFVEDGKAAPPDTRAEFRRKDFRIAVTQLEASPPQQYTIPQWPARWEKNLRAMQKGGEA